MLSLPPFFDHPRSMSRVAASLCSMARISGSRFAFGQIVAEVLPMSTPDEP